INTPLSISICGRRELELNQNLLITRRLLYPQSHNRGNLSLVSLSHGQTRDTNMVLNLIISSKLTAAIVFLSFGVVASFLCLMIDGVGVLLNMDVRPLKAGRCQYYSSGSSYVYENFYTTVPCRNLRESCTMTIRSGTCYCCDLYNCANGDYMNNYFEFVGVQSCEEVFTLYILIWTLTGVNLVAFFTGILTAAVLGNIKVGADRSSGPIRTQKNSVLPVFFLTGSTQRQRKQSGT
uniref:Transmembrane protein 255B-like n=1 Tax=Poecilia reticulata TaxID=8081 RepID=A0A3P9PZB1_POERE